MPTRSWSRNHFILFPLRCGALTAIRSLTLDSFPTRPRPALFPVRGRYELVLQEALDRRRVIATFDNLDLHVDELATLPELEAAWSPDGEYLAVPRPGRTPAIAIVRVDRGSVQKTIASASRPAWSPDGSRLAYLVPGRGGPSNQFVQVMGRDFRQGPALIELSQVNGPPVWSTDRQSLLVVCRRALSRGRELEVIRIAIDSGEPSRALPITILPPENLTAGRMFNLETDDRGPSHRNRVSIGFDREQEQCVFATDIHGQPPVLCVANVGRGNILRRFHPLDITIRMGALALAPDSQTVAVRMNSAGKAAPPLLCDLGTEAVRFIVPDASIRREWALTLAHAAQSLLQAGLQEPTVDGRRVQRATLLPIRGEIPEHSPLISRIRHLGKVGRSLLDQPLGQQSTPAGEDSGLDEALDEYRLFFDYLREDYTSAEADLEALEPRASTADRRLMIVGLRAQILQAQGQFYKARPIIDYLIRLQGAQPRQIEDTPLGPVLSAAGGSSLSLAHVSVSVHDPQQDVARRQPRRRARHHPSLAPPGPPRRSRLSALISCPESLTDSASRASTPGGWVAVPSAPTTNPASFRHRRRPGPSTRRCPASAGPRPIAELRPKKW